MPSRTPRARCNSAGSGARSALHKPASVSQARAAAGSLYPGVTVLMARMVLGERLRWIQRAGLVLAAIGILLVAA